jgi:hypothetical protein
VLPATSGIVPGRRRERDQGVKGNGRYSCSSGLSGEIGRSGSDLVAFKLTVGDKLRINANGGVIIFIVFIVSALSFAWCVENSKTFDSMLHGGCGKNSKTAKHLSPVFVLCTVCTVYYCVLCNVYCVLCTVYCVLCTVYCVLCTVCTVYYSERGTVYYSERALFGDESECVLCTTVYCVMYTVYCVLCTVCCVLCTVYCVLCVLCVLCTVMYTVYCVLCTVYCVLLRARDVCVLVRTRDSVMCTVCCVLCTVYYVLRITLHHYLLSIYHHG